MANWHMGISNWGCLGTYSGPPHALAKTSASPCFRAMTFSLPRQQASHNFMFNIGDRNI